MNDLQRATTAARTLLCILAEVDAIEWLYLAVEGSSPGTLGLEGK